MLHLFLRYLAQRFIWDLSNSHHKQCKSCCFLCFLVCWGRFIGWCLTTLKWLEELIYFNHVDDNDNVMTTVTRVNMSCYTFVNSFYYVCLLYIHLFCYIFHFIALSFIGSLICYILSFCIWIHFIVFYSFHFLVHLSS